MEFERKKYNHTHINIAPLVDVALLLLLFFMLTSYLIQEPVINIKLPESKTAEPKEKEILTIHIAKGGEIYFMDRRVNLEGLHEEIKNSLINMKIEFLRIKADKDADVGTLISVIDEVRLAGIRNYSIVTERR